MKVELMKKSNYTLNQIISVVKSFLIIHADDIEAKEYLTEIYKNNLEE